MRHFYFLFILSAALLMGCSKSDNPIKHLSLNEAQNKLQSLLTDEYELKARVKPLERTLWVYIALEGDLLRFKANTDAKAYAPTDMHEAMSLRFLDGQYENKAFKIQYDIGINRAYNRDYGYTTDYHPELQRIQQNVLTAVHRVYSEVAEDEVSPDFIVITIADIQNGLRTEMTAALKDVQRAFFDQGFSEEYVRRIISGYPKGDANIIGDVEGKNLELKDYTWGEFIIKQIIYRIQFKYTQSAFPPSEETKEELFKETHTVIHNYSFEDFLSVELTDLIDNSTSTMSQDDLLAIPVEEVSQPKIYHMKFDLPSGGE